MPSTVWKGQLTFGLVSLPVRLFRAARKERVPLRYLRQAPTERDSFPEIHVSKESGRPQPFEEDDESESPLPPVSPVRQTFTALGDEGPSSRQDLVRGYEVAPDQYVVFKNDELRRLRPATSPDMQIIRSVRLADIDPVYFETSYYVVPDPGGERAYALLYLALEKSQYVAVAKVAMHGREHIMVIRPGQRGLLAHTMYYTDEIRAQSEFDTNTSDVGAKEMQLATSFVEAISGPFAPEEFKDSYREQMHELISGKRDRQEIASTPSPDSRPVSKPSKAPVVDIMDALKESLALAKKPPAQEQQTSKRKPARVTQMKSKTQRRKT